MYKDGKEKWPSSIRALDKEATVCHLSQKYQRPPGELQGFHRLTKASYKPIRVPNVHFGELQINS